jgi:LysM domain-containing protein
MPRRSAFPFGLGCALVGLGLAFVLLTTAHFLLRDEDFDIEDSGSFEFELEGDDEPVAASLRDEERSVPPTWREAMERQRLEFLSREAEEARLNRQDYRHELREGESLSDLARRYLGSEDELPLLLESNPELADQARIVPGDVVVIPFSRRP